MHEREIFIVEEQEETRSLLGAIIKQKRKDNPSQPPVPVFYGGLEPFKAALEEVKKEGGHLKLAIVDAVLPDSSRAATVRGVIELQQETPGTHFAVLGDVDPLLVRQLEEFGVSYISTRGSIVQSVNSILDKTFQSEGE